MSHLRWLPGHTLPFMEREGSRLLQGRTNTCQCILVLQDVPLNIIGYLIIIAIVIIIVVVGVLPLFPHLQLSLPLPLVVLLCLPQPLALDVICRPHGQIPRQ